MQLPHRFDGALGAELGACVRRRLELEPRRRLLLLRLDGRRRLATLRACAATVYGSVSLFLYVFTVRPKKGNCILCAGS